MHLDRVSSGRGGTRSQQALIERTVSIRRLHERIALRSFSCGQLQSCTFPVVGTEDRESPVQRTIVAWIDEQRSSAPELPEGRDVREDQGASSGSSFQHGKAEWFVTGRPHENGCPLHARSQGAVCELTHKGDPAGTIAAEIGSCSRHEQRPIQSLRSAYKRRNIFGGVPHPAGRKDEASLGAGWRYRRRYPVPNHGTGRNRPVQGADDVMKCPAGTYPGLRLIQAGGDGPCVVLPFRLRQPFGIIARESPGVHAGMRDDKDRRKPVESCLAKAVEMDDIGLDLVFEIFEKAARIRQVFRAWVLPFDA